MGRKSSEKYPGQRNKEKRLFWGKFFLRVIEDHYKELFFSSFGRRCFRCGTPERPNSVTYGPKVLCIDHHIPIALGGHLQAGNLVALCRRCNQQKLDTHPNSFYTPKELEKLQPLLNAQDALFAFTFDGEKWARDREAYLLEIGIAPAIVHSTLHDETFSGYVEPPYALETGITIALDIDDIDKFLSDIQSKGQS